VEVIRDAQDDGFPLRDALLLVGPLPGELDGSLNGFSAGVHGENHVISKDLCYLLCELSKHGVVECTRRQSQLLRLLYQRRYYLWMTMSLK
jgi:hypothetical protein